MARAGSDDVGLRELKYVDQERGVYRRLLVRDDVPVGAVLLGEIGDAGVLRSAIINGRRLWPSGEAVIAGRATHAGRVMQCLGAVTHDHLR